MNPEWNLDQPRMDIEGMNSIQNKNWIRFVDIMKKKEIVVIQIKKSGLYSLKKKLIFF